MKIWQSILVVVVVVLLVVFILIPQENAGHAAVDIVDTHPTKVHTLSQHMAVNQLSNQSTLAKIANRHAEDLCPYIIQKRIDTTTIIRSDRMKKDSCEYFVYPKIGDAIYVSLSDKRIKSTLQSPYLHDFANGVYLVKMNGRHVIRLTYDSFDKRPKVLIYDIVVDIKPA